MLDFIWATFITTPAMYYPSDWIETVAYNPSLLYSTLVVAILLTKGYGRYMAMAIGKKILRDPSRKLWRAIRAIKPRQIMYYGLRWGIPLHQLKDLLLLHRNLLKKRPRTTRRCNNKDKKISSLKRKSINSTVTLYRKMPFNSMSRAWGKMMTWELPLTLREPLLGLYVWLFNVQLHEAEDCNLKNYRNLQEFFRRQLKPDARIVDTQSPVTSPADGTILHYGKVENGIVEQVKGVNYSIKGFLGPHRGDEDCSKPLKDCQYQQKMNLKPDNELHHCIIYLAPGDYHRFHSPCDWKIASRRHFPGELLSVNPGIARWVQGLFNMNERVVYSGTWDHGFFSYTAVGATNVGSIKIYFDKNLETNTRKSQQTSTYHDEVFTENISMRKGEMIGEFNLGSTIVLLFEAPKNFKFNINPGQKVMYGQSIGGFEV
ncbi:hypothetical protein ACF0H5_016557 [Mactra antiquata]